MWSTQFEMSWSKQIKELKIEVILLTVVISEFFVKKIYLIIEHFHAHQDYPFLFICLHEREQDQVIVEILLKSVRYYFSLLIVVSCAVHQILNKFGTQVLNLHGVGSI